MVAELLAAAGLDDSRDAECRGYRPIVWGDSHQTSRTRRRGSPNRFPLETDGGKDHQKMAAHDLFLGVHACYFAAV
jgi:hypothetical protein